MHITKTMPTALTIAGSDCSGGAGIQADIKTMTMHGVYAMSAITALTAQNTTGITATQTVSPAFLAQQLDAIFTDIRPDAVKIGMVADAGLIHTIAQKLTDYRAEHIIIDPVMVASAGQRLLADAALTALTDELLPLAELVTPNIPEAEILAGQSISSEKDRLTAAAAIYDRYHCHVLLKAGHASGDANDLLYLGDTYHWIDGQRLDNPNTHGTGCTLSSAIAANLAKGLPLVTAVELAKEYLTGTLLAMLDLGKGSGPLNHAFSLTQQ
ncbi:hydroxymethylpyrimidine/phosphomethylpyrimidine kinase [Selenomonas sp. GACV-9]|uniref:bifunctional hydroxymethylpyrimidine kinase/phosphomethylpyrimidine kinase n=1 Tax=Selenomonas sp. GACV-9 TaxID=3158782 RepID=UPI0008F04D20|nr:hydroxymethylpyrimidine/phosphomethylpyrimidine kinase [Selenomonas ruminantium]